jgi:hypothetical protein
MSLTDIHKRHLLLMQHTLSILGHSLAGVSQAMATTRRDPNDGDKGWSVVEVLCHLRDYDVIFQGRAQLMCTAEYPPLPGYDHEALAIERRYNEQDLRQVYAELVASRGRFVQFFQSLTAEGWTRAGIHPERGHFTMTDACVQVGTHEALHIEQILRILRGDQL